MPTIPKGIIDAGGIAIALFLFTASIWLVWKIVEAVRKPQAQANGNGKRHPACFETPVVGQLISVQQGNTRLLEKLDASAIEISTTIALQTQLLERVAAVQEKIGDCIARQDARDSARAGRPA